MKINIVDRKNRKDREDRDNYSYYILIIISILCFFGAITVWLWYYESNQPPIFNLSKHTYIQPHIQVPAPVFDNTYQSPVVPNATNIQKDESPLVDVIPSSQAIKEDKLDILDKSIDKYNKYLTKIDNAYTKYLEMNNKLEMAKNEFIHTNDEDEQKEINKKIGYYFKECIVSEADIDLYLQLALEEWQKLVENPLLNINYRESDKMLPITQMPLRDGHWALQFDWYYWEKGKSDEFDRTRTK